MGLPPFRRGGATPRMPAVGGRPAIAKLRAFRVAAPSVKLQENNSNRLKNEAVAVPREFPRGCALGALLAVKKMTLGTHELPLL